MSCFVPQIPLLTDRTMALQYPESSGRPRRNRIHRKYLCWWCNHIKLASIWHSNRIELYRTTSQFLTSCSIWCWKFVKHDIFNTKSPLSSVLLEIDTNIVTSLISFIPALTFWSELCRHRIIDQQWSGCGSVWKMIYIVWDLPQFFESY